MLAALILAAVTAVASTASAKPADLAFMQGEWEGGTAKFKVEERWTEEAGGLMLGVGRTLKGDRAIGFEFLRIEFRPDGVFYVGQPGGHPPTEFKLTETDGKSATFENPQHDHPKKIRYSLAPDGGLVADLDGDEGKQSFRYKAVKK
jgi:hypothetical protein